MIECFHVCQVTFVEVTINSHHLKNQLSLLQYEKPPIIICNSLPFHSKTNKTLKTQMVVQGTAFSHPFMMSTQSVEEQGFAGSVKRKLFFADANDG